MKHSRCTVDDPQDVSWVIEAWLEEAVVEATDTLKERIEELEAEVEELQQQSVDASEV